MEYIEKIKKMLCKELDEYAIKSKLTMSDLQPVHLMTDIIKNLDKIEMLEDEGGYSEAIGGMRGRSYMHGSSYDDDMMYSERRGRGRNAKRDSVGRYSSDDGMSYEGGSSYDSGSSYARNGRGGNRGYSRDDGKERMIEHLEDLAENADTKSREAIHRAIKQIENA